MDSEKKNKKESIKDTEMKIFRRIAAVRLWDRKRSKEIRNKLGLEPLNNKVRDNTLRCFGYVVKMPTTSQIKKAWKMGITNHGT